MRRRHGPVMFAATAGPRRGFGHLVRCGVLADALGVPRLVALRRISAETARTARRLGWMLRDCRALQGDRPELLIVDDPSAVETGRWVDRARRLGIAVASIHDGDVVDARADLVIDGSAVSRYQDVLRRASGPAFAVLRDSPRKWRPRVGHATPRVVIALGGGIHVKRLGARIASAIVRRLPHAEVRVAAGFARRLRQPLPAQCRWIAPDDGLSLPLSEASACVVSGGVTLYEACAMGTPAVAVAVVPAQQPAVTAVVRSGAALTVNLERKDGPDRLADLMCHLLGHTALQRALSRNAQRLVDGRGTARVAQRLRQLMDRHRGDAIHAVA